MSQVPRAPARGRRLLSVLVALVVVAALATGGYLVYSRWGANPGCQAGAAGCSRVFFLGNSYTAVNDLPYVFAALAWSGGHRVDTAAIAPGGWSLADHAADPDTQTTLAALHWDWVVLQEQSEIPAVESDRQQLMYPGARELVTAIRAAGAQPIFYETWAHRDGWPSAGLPDYHSMQLAIDQAYDFISQDQSAALAPVGRAWAEIVNDDPNPGLWQGDGSHPTAKGTYLAACVLYAVIFHESPLGLGYHQWISGADATEAQAAAANVVPGLPASPAPS